MIYALAAQNRTETGRRSKHVLAEGMIPAVIYGHGVEPQSIKVHQSEFRKVYRGAGMSSLIDLTIGSNTVKVIVKEMQVDRVQMTPAHIDFHQVRMDEKMTTEIPLKFIGEAAAVRVLSGTLITNLTSIEVTCLPKDLPHEIEVDLSLLATFDDVITIGSLTLPTGVTATHEADSVIATVAAPLTEEQLKKLEESEVGDVTAIKTEAEEKKAAEAAKKADEEAG
ncbi:50S ribosomal protein L25 [Candidatus Uhrbacteria bacterium]|nr:50S ribosomal protein L25 [Candidatus Uhrbacteria bacterium]